MLEPKDIKQAEPNNIFRRRLAWRCRRGLLELDLVLQNFVNTQFEQLNLNELTAFDALLEWPDNDFWDAINHPDGIADASIRSVIDKIKAN